jgi:hypothetical protein
MATTYLVTLALDEKWFKAIDDFTRDVYDGELCSWIRVDADTEGEVDGDEEDMIESELEA